MPLQPYHSQLPDWTGHAASLGAGAVDGDQVLAVMPLHPHPSQLPEVWQIVTCHTRYPDADLTPQTPD